MQCAGNPMGMFGSPTEAKSSCLHILLQLILPLRGSVPLTCVFTVFGTFKCLSPNLPPGPVNWNIKQNRQHKGHDQQKQANAPFHVSTTLWDLQCVQWTLYLPLIRSKHMTLDTIDVLNYKNHGCQ